MKPLPLLMLLLMLLLFGAATVVAQDDVDDEKAIRFLSEVIKDKTTARRHLTELRAIAESTPYRLEEIIAVSRQLLSWGWQESESKTIIRACADAAAATRANDQGFARIAIWVGKLNNAEQSTYTALSGLEHEGIPVWQILSRRIGQTELRTRALSSERLLRPRTTADTLLAGFEEKYAGAAEREAGKTKPKPSSPSGVDNAGQTRQHSDSMPAEPSDGTYQAEIVRIRLEPFVTAQGKSVQKLLIDWKNTGSLSIGQVVATVTFFDADGQPLDEIKHWSVFTTHDRKQMIRPGRTYQEPNTDGFVFVTPDGSKAATAKALLTKIAGLPSL